MFSLPLAPLLSSSVANGVDKKYIYIYTPPQRYSRRGHSSHPLDFGRKFVLRSNRLSPSEVQLLET